ncbi:phospholipase A2-like [Maniola hyperantus]|uniref:phospholipase A2-like n=1 Tax=Aphantopus hyperantus TaxID=2795564 RepID=UPI001568B778|nr:phospholipase A2-like [Maniola hyperantus]
MINKMALKSIAVLVIISLIHSSQCWIFNDIRTRTVQDNALEIDYEDLTPEDLARLRFSLIYPGTKWCGPGNVAENYDDLGPSQAADACCRDHDNCPEYITAGDSKHNLTNNSYFTRLSCHCDEKFRRCLQNADTKTSATIGYMYFNVIGSKCYRKDYLITGCKKEGGWLNTKCVEYSYNTSSEKTHQWFDVPNFNSARLLARTRILNSRR